MKRGCVILILLLNSLYGQNCIPSVSSNTAICMGQTCTLVAGGASSYTWAPAGSLNNPNNAGVVASPTINIIYTVTATTGTCVASNTVQVIVNPLPVFSISPSASAGCVPHCVSFSSTYSGPGTCNWSFGNGANSSSCAPINCFITAGTYTSTLVITDNNGCSDTNSVLIQGYPVPLSDFSFNPNPPSNGIPVNFTDLTAGAGIASWSWDFNDGNVSTLQSPTHIFSLPGNYLVSLKVVTNYGCTDSIMKTVQVDPVGLRENNGNIQLAAYYDISGRCLVINELFLSETRLAVYNSLGDIMYAEFIPENQKKFRIDCRDWEPGSYFLRLSGKSFQTQRKFFVLSP